MSHVFSPAFYIPIWFNLTLLICGLSLTITTIYFLVVKIYPWFVNLPLLAYGLHFSIFYGMISFAQLTGHLLDNETMTLWSAILRFQGVMTAIAMMFIVYILLGAKCNDRHQS